MQYVTQDAKVVHHYYDLRRSPIYFRYFSLGGDGRVAPHGYSQLYLCWSRNESYGVVHSDMLASPDWLHTQSWLTMSQNTCTDDVAMRLMVDWMMLNDVLLQFIQVLLN